VLREPEQHDERLMELVESALALPEMQRDAWIWECCPDDPELAAEVRLRIRWETEMEGFLNEPILWNDETNDLQPGQALGDRLIVVRRIADGGMATVYQVEDENLGPLAIKIPKPAFRRRLLAEARFALQVTHPNICRVHGVDSAQTDGGETNFLTMEYLEGETLQDRLQRGPLSLDEYRNLAEQVCAGLAEAHRRGVVHGDLKGSNVILTKRDGSTVAVITDFGLARVPGRDPSSIASSIRGTPDFLAPEIWSGREFSIASDLYALGVLLYEAATGERPFTEDPSRRRGDPLVPPRRRRRDLPRRWSSIIESCLGIDPASRPRGAMAVADAFAPSRNPSARTIAASIAFIILAIVAGMIFSRKATTGDLIRIAVLPIEADNDVAALGAGALREIATTLPRYRSSGGAIVVIPALDNLGSQPEATFKRVGATHLVKSKFRSVDGNIHADLSISDTRTGQELKSFSGTYTQASVGSLPQALVSAVRSALQLSGSVPPPRIKPDAWFEYLKGSGELQRPQPDLDAALASFRTASQLDPEASLPWAGLTMAFQMKSALKNDPSMLEQARATLRDAVSRGPDEIEVHLAAGYVFRASGIPDRAAAEFSRVLQLQPGNVEAMRRLAQSYSDMDMPVQAVQTWQQALSQLPNYYRTHLDLGQFYYYRARYNDAAQEFKLVTELAPNVAMGHHDLGAVYNDLGRFEEAEQAFRHALTLREHSDTLIGLGSVMDHQRRASEAVTFYERAKEVGPVTYLLLVNLADAYRRVQRNTDARRTYEEALILADRDLLERPRDGYVRAYVAYLSARLGDRARAERELGQALRFSPDETKIKRTAVLTYGALGRLQDAESMLAAEPALQDEMTRQPDVAEFSAPLRLINK